MGDLDGCGEHGHRRVIWGDANGQGTVIHVSVPGQYEYAYYDPRDQSLLGAGTARSQGARLALPRPADGWHPVAGGVLVARRTA